MYLWAGSESMALSGQRAVVPAHGALQVAIRASCAVAHHTAFLFLPQRSPENVLSVQLVQQPPRAGSVGSSTPAWNSFSSLCPEISYKS